jgi:hypothetical protein
MNVALPYEHCHMNIMVSFDVYIIVPFQIIIIQELLGYKCKLSPAMF